MKSQILLGGFLLFGLTGCFEVKTHTLDFEMKPLEFKFLNDCKEADAPKISTQGNGATDSRVHYNGLNGAANEPSSLGLIAFKPVAINMNCDDAFAKEMAGDLKIEKFDEKSQNYYNAQMLLLCGPSVASFTMQSETVVMKDFKQVVAGFGSVHIDTKNLIVKGDNSIKATSISGNLFALNVEKVNIKIDKVDGDGDLTVDAAARSCAQVKADDDKKKADDKAKSDAEAKAKTDEALKGVKGI